MQKLGWIGTGKMGNPMTRRLLGEGYEMYVCDVVKENTDNLVSMGATYAASPMDVAEKAEIVFSIIPNSAVLREVVFGEKGLLKTVKVGSIYVDMSTVDAEVSAEVNAALEEKGAKFIRSCVSGSVAFAEAGTLAGLNSGDPKTYETVLPMLKILTNRQYYLGEGEEGRYMKIIINMMLGSNLQAMAESLVLGKSLGIDWELMVEALVDSAAACPSVRFRSELYKTREFTCMSSVGIMDKDMDIALDIAKKKNLAVPLASVARQMYCACGSTGRWDMDCSAVLLQNEDLNGMKND